MLAKFRQRYPQGSLVSELIEIERGFYLVKVSVQVEQIVLATGLAGAGTIEAAEDSARERAIAALVLDNGESATVENSTANTYTTALKDRSSTEPTVTRVSLDEPERKTVNPEHESAVHEDFRLEEERARTDTRRKGMLSDAGLVPDTPSDLSARLKQSEASTLPEPANETASIPEPIPDPRSQPEISSSPQPNLFSGTYTTPTEVPTESESNSIAPVNSTTSAIATPNIEEMDFNEIKQKTDIEIKRLGWTKDDGREFLKSRYGKRSRLHLTDEQLLEFLEYLEQQPTPVK